MAHDSIACSRWLESIACSRWWVAPLSEGSWDILVAKWNVWPNTTPCWIKLILISKHVTWYNTCRNGCVQRSGYYSCSSRNFVSGLNRFVETSKMCQKMCHTRTTTFISWFNNITLKQNKETNTKNMFTTFVGNRITFSLIDVRGSKWYTTRYNTIMKWNYNYNNQEKSTI